MIRIRAKQKQGFRRCGMFHPAEPVDHPDNQFTLDELEVLLAEPMLQVEMIRNDGKPNPSGEDAGKDDPAGEDAGKDDPAEAEQALLLAAQQAMDNGDVTREGKPTVEAMEEILGYDISAADRDRVYETLTGGGE